MKLIIGSDLVPTNVNIDLFNNGDVVSLLGDDLYQIWNSVDVRIFNLETPLTDKSEPIEKQGPNLIAPTSTIKGIKKLDPTLITLANNHILDHGTQGLDSTMDLLDKNNIPFIGAGDNLLDASEPYIIEKNGIKVGVYTCAEYEFTIAGEDSPGANPFDPLESLDHISELKSKCNYVIVLYHGGKEHYRYPSPYLQKVCRKIVEKGADLIVCQHSHCVGAYEKFNNSTIVYGQGNFIFNKHDNEYWNNSILIKVSIEKELKIDYIPIVTSRKGIMKAITQESNKILNDFEMRSKNILKKNFIEENYYEFAQENLDFYLRRFSGFGKWLSRIDRRLLNNFLLRKVYDDQKLLAIRNYIECEAHRELILKGVSNAKEKSTTRIN